jgi:hypothetical protein
MATNRFAILNDYPPEGPEVPEREKVRRAKNKHEPGTGRRDNTKRQGAGPSNWGNPLQESTLAATAESAPQESETPEGEAPKQAAPEFVPASSIFGDSDDEVEVAPAANKKVQVIPSEFANMVVKKEGVEVDVRDEDDEENEFEVDFISTAEVRRQQQQRQSEQRRGGPRPNRGGPRPNRGGPRPNRGAPRKEGEFRPRREEGGDKPQEQRRGGPRREEGQQQRRGGPQRRDDRKARDQRQSGVQHQRNYGAQRGGNLSLNQFPSL